ncbi:MAG: hypothetical protein GXY81_07560 [Candidatus Cloacimonetes bacterium]|nr:hypothetical protein [Candidatus Cloacimonadota bacterium]
MKQSLIITLILVVFSGCVFAAKIIPQNSYELMTEEWMNSQVNCIIFDDYTAWIGTDGGVMSSTLDFPNIMDVFDSQSVKLPSDNVTALALKGPGTLWVGTDNGLAILDAFDYGATIPKSSPFRGLEITTLAVEKSGKLWANARKIHDMDGAGLMGFDGNTWQSFTSQKTSLAENLMNAIVIGADNTKWLGTTYIPFAQDFGSGLCSYDGKSFKTYNPEGRGSVECMAMDARGNVWMGLASLTEGGISGDGLAKFDGKTWTYYNTDNSDIPGDYISSISIAKDGKIWMAVSDTSEGYPAPVGLVSFDGKEWKILNHKLLSGYNAEITALAVDPEGKIWVGKGNGLVVVKFK